VEVVAAIFRRTSESGQVHSLLRCPTERSGTFPVHGVLCRLSDYADSGVEVLVGSS
jgi:hypothetical protein